jgi:hypothetical protein
MRLRIAQLKAGRVQTVNELSTATAAADLVLRLVLTDDFVASAIAVSKLLAYALTYR